MVTAKIYPEFDIRFVRTFLLHSVVYSIRCFHVSLLTSVILSCSVVSTSSRCCTFHIHFHSPPTCPICERLMNDSLVSSHPPQSITQPFAFDKLPEARPVTPQTQHLHPFRFEAAIRQVPVCLAPREARRFVQPNGLADSDASWFVETARTQDRHDQAPCRC